MTYRKLSTTFWLITLLISSLILFNACEDNLVESNKDNCWRIEENKFSLDWRESDATGPFIVEVFYDVDYADGWLNDTIWLNNGTWFEYDWEWMTVEKAETYDKYFISEKYYLRDDYYWRVTQKNTGTLIKDNRFEFIYNDLSLLNGDYLITEIYPDHGSGFNNHNRGISLGGEIGFNSQNSYDPNAIGSSLGMEIYFHFGSFHYQARSPNLTKEGEILTLFSTINIGSGSVATCYPAIFKFDFENCTIEYEDENESHFKIEKIW